MFNFNNENSLMQPISNNVITFNNVLKFHATRLIMIKKFKKIFFNKALITKSRNPFVIGIMIKANKPLLTRSCNRALGPVA